jgi:hypothetical protein
VSGTIFVEIQKSLLAMCIAWLEHGHAAPSSLGVLMDIHSLVFSSAGGSLIYSSQLSRYIVFAL